MTYLLASVGGFLSLVGVIYDNSLNIMCGTIYVCSAFIVAAIQGKNK